MKIASAIGGKIRSSADLSNDFNVSDILDTDTVFIKTDIVNGFAYGFVEDTGLWGYCHLSILKDFDDTTVSAGAVPTHKVVSDIGCHARKNAYLWSESLMILDTDQLVTVLYPENDFYYCEFTLSDGTAHNAYIHNSVISPLS